MSTTATRLITLILLLQNRPNQKAAGLAEELGISIRTLHRYIGMIEGMGIPVYSERGPYGGFSLVRGYRLPPLQLSAEEATAVSLGAGMVEEIWGGLYRDACCSVRAKLDNVLPDEQRAEAAWARRSLVALDLRHAGLDDLTATLETLRRALRDSCQVEMLYASASSREPSRRILDPYALAFRSGWWYLAGYCHTRGEVRTFRVDRILEVGILSTHFEKPGDFDARAYLAGDFQGRSKVLARLRFRPEAAHIARAQRLAWEWLEEQADGSVQVGMASPDPEWAAASILMYGPAVEVLDPPELRDLVRDTARATAGQYS